jgi:serine/threonine protein kinase
MGNLRTFHFIQCVGRGGFGDVYRARMRTAGGLDREVAVKVLRTGIGPRAEDLSRIQDEAHLLARLNHPHILQVVDIVSLRGCVSLVTEYVDGGDLSQCFRMKPALSMRAILEVGGRVSRALLDAFHAPLRDSSRPLRLVHRDIKPSNIGIGRYGDVRLLDFGIAMANNPKREAHTESNVVMGSQPYMAPERYRGEAATTATDVFSLGATLFEGHSGEAFYEGVALMQRMAMAQNMDHYEAFKNTRLQVVSDGLPVEVFKLLDSMLAGQSAQRPNTSVLALCLDQMAASAKGVSLEAWARKASWDADSGVVEGDWVGDTITEDVDRPLNTGDIVDRQKPTKQRGPKVLFACLCLIVLGVLGWYFQADDLASDAEKTPIEVQPILEVDPIQPVVLTEKEDLPADLKVERLESPHAHKPEVSSSKFAAMEETKSPPKAIDSAPDSVDVGLIGGISVNLRGPNGSFVLPSKVPPGTYEIWGQYNGRDSVHSGVVSVEAGRSIVIRCSARLYRCEVN